MLIGGPVDLTNLNINHYYRNFGAHDVVKELLEPVSEYTDRLKYFSGLFSNDTFSEVFKLLYQFRKTCRSFTAIICFDCNKVDYDQTLSILDEQVSKEFERSFSTFLIECDDDLLINIYSYLKRGILRFIVCTTETPGFYSNRYALVDDAAGNQLAFYGNLFPKDSASCEKIRVLKKWIPGQKELVEEDEQEFNNILTGKDPYTHIVDCCQSLDAYIYHEMRNRKLEKTNSNVSNPVILRSYQQEAIEAWVKNGYQGFLVMATGTGKTWTAIYAAKELTDLEPLFLVICAPYKHLIKQWYEDIRRVYADCSTVLISSENHNWEDELLQAVFNSKYGDGGTVIAISTIKSFNTEKFKRIAGKTNLKRMLIVDEAHRFKVRDEYIHKQYQYLLGLSATPSTKKDDEIGKELMQFFGGPVFSLPIDYAIQKGHLVHYSYHPIFVDATENEERIFDEYTRKIMSCFRNNVCIDLESLAKYKRARLRVISMAEEKIERISDIIKSIHPQDHFIVYCGDGKMFDQGNDEGIRYIQLVKNCLTELGYKASQFTADENMETRMQLVNAFNTGQIDSLVAIRCLDEGINIPSIKSALIMSSNDDYREFIQRRGRILRTYDDPYTGVSKQKADIYDVVVLPSSSSRTFALLELRRLYEYARIADNAEECFKTLFAVMSDYSISLDDLSDTGYTEEDEVDE